MNKVKWVGILKFILLCLAIVPLRKLMNAGYELSTWFCLVIIAGLLYGWDEVSPVNVSCGNKLLGLICSALFVVSILKLFMTTYQ